MPYASATPAHMWEIGLHSGIAFGLSDIEFTPGIGGGVHVRRALDYVFSLRGELLAAKLKHDDTVNGNTETTFQAGTLELLVSLNNLVWNANRNRKTNVYGIVGAGLNRFKVDVTKAISNDLNPLDYSTQSHGGVGLGMSFRMSNRFNLGVETKAAIFFGKNSDRLDGVARQNGDVLSYSSIRLNFNIGNTEKRAEPLYWVNPMDAILQDVTELKNKPVFDTADTDGDGVIDLLDQDNSTPPGVEVNTRGLPLDSDGDGIPNHDDPTPFSSSENMAGTDGQAPTEADIERIVNQRLNQYDQTGQVPVPGTNGKGSGNPFGGNSPSTTRPGATGNIDAALANWFLPIVHFNIDSDKIRYADYGSLASIAKMMKANPGLRIVVMGFTDKTASDTYNLDLSYKRARNAIKHLVNVHGIERSRLVLNYNGEDDPLVPSTGSSLMNRRVEFRVANNNDRDMPAPPTKKRRRRRF